MPLVAKTLNPASYGPILVPEGCAANRATEKAMSIIPKSSIIPKKSILPKI